MCAFICISIYLWKFNNDLYFIFYLDFLKSQSLYLFAYLYLHQGRRSTGYIHSCVFNYKEVIVISRPSFGAFSCFTESKQTETKNSQTSPSSARPCRNSRKTLRKVHNVKVSTGRVLRREQEKNPTFLLRRTLLELKKCGV